MEFIWLALILGYSIILHEVSHGIVAYWNGDPTAKQAGRLTLNPFPHIDPIGTILLPALLILMKSGILFGWAKPVPFNPIYFRNKKLGLFTVGIAGPVANILLAIGFAAILSVLGPRHPAATFLFYGASVNMFLAVFNLIPIPPLDGSRAVAVFLPKPLLRAYFSLEPFGFVLIFILLYTGILHQLLMPVYASGMRALGLFGTFTP